jgi:C-terminal processing protease CtpA/Prc
MNKRTLAVAGGIGALALTLVALPSPSATSQEQNDCSGLQQKLEAMQQNLAGQEGTFAQLRDNLALQASLRDLAQEQENWKALEISPEAQELTTIFSGDEGASWLGVETHEVTSDKAKELKLPSERGVVVGKVIPDSPAAKAGLKENDVVTEINGQRVEGTAQFRRMIREIPAGRTAQFTVWRDGRSQTISATLGKAEEGHHMRFQAAPGTYTFHMPEVPELRELPNMDWEGMLAPLGHPRLGIDAEDLSGQFGSYFGAPDGEGVLVRDVNSGSPAEKAGLKAGDVIISVDGDRIRSVGDLREKLAPKSDDKERTVKLGVLRNRNNMTLNVELPAPAERHKHAGSHRTNI